MVIITLAGASSRFFNNGYSVVKYKLKYNNKSIIENILVQIPRSTKLLIALNVKFNDEEYLRQILVKLEFVNFCIIEVFETKGQLETLIISLTSADSFITEKEEIVVYNGDTIRNLSKWSNFPNDGYIEVFEAAGNHWSFVDKIGIVSIVKEKERISSFCSSGLYAFKNKNLILENYNTYKTLVKSELYIAPFYQFLIENKFRISSGLVSNKSFVFCGTPQEYISSINSKNGLGK
jgi:dTDP-glucose pyrophosphorylase